MKDTRLKNSVFSQKTIVATKKKPSKAASLLKKTPSTPTKKLISPEIAETNERNEWRKEKREYWGDRFRKILADIAVRPKPKKSSFF